MTLAPVTHQLVLFRYDQQLNGLAFSKHLLTSESACDTPPYRRYGSIWLFPLGSSGQSIVTMVS